VTWLSTVGTGLISAVICSRMAFRQLGGEEAWTAAAGLFRTPTTILGLVEVVVPASC
jgi:hypothetical protein